MTDVSIMGLGGAFYPIPLRGSSALEPYQIKGFLDYLAEETGFAVSKEVKETFPFGSSSSVVEISGSIRQDDPKKLIVTDYFFYDSSFYIRRVSDEQFLRTLMGVVNSFDPSMVFPVVSSGRQYYYLGPRSSKP